MQTREIESRTWNGWLVVALLVAAGAVQAMYWKDFRPSGFDPWRVGFAVEGGAS